MSTAVYWRFKENLKISHFYIIECHDLLPIYNSIELKTKSIITLICQKMHIQFLKTLLTDT